MPSSVNLLIDTGSSNTWAGAQSLTNPFVDSSTTKELGELAVCMISLWRTYLTTRPVSLVCDLWIRILYRWDLFQQLSQYLMLSHIGRQVEDQVQLGNLTIPSQSMSAALISEGFDTVDGILGYEGLPTLMCIRMLIFCLLKHWSHRPDRWYVLSFDP